MLELKNVEVIYDDVILVFKKNSEADKWKDFDLVPIPEIPALPWGLAVKLEELNEPWGKYMSDTVKDWLKTADTTKAVAYVQQKPVEPPAPQGAPGHSHVLSPPPARATSS